MKKFIQKFAFCFTILLLLCSIVWAQSFKATIVGKVTDQNGAIVPGASVTVTQATKNFSQTVTTNDNGEYVIP